jgi:hypothetical protein
MKFFGLVRGAAVSLAALGMVMPQAQVFAQDGNAAKSSIVTKSDAKLAADVVLIEGAFTGRVVDHTGTPLVDKEVVVKQSGKEVARVTTNEKGVFSVKNVKPGNYVASTGNTDGNFRVWNEKTAPASAKGHALLVMGQNGARGQFGAVDPTLVLLTVAVIASVIISAIALGKINDLQDDVDQIPKSP